MADRCYLVKCRDRLYPDVVLGGLASAMLLTMIVLPALYYLVETRKETRDETLVAAEVK